MGIDSLRLIFDTGLVILIWIVQLIIYPSFNYMKEQDLIRWHKKYTVRIGCIVMALMLGQLGIYITQFLQQPEFYSSVSLVLIILVWSSTFLQFVPMHRKISNERIPDGLLDRLVHLNWVRTSLWTVVFMSSLYTCI